VLVPNGIQPHDQRMSFSRKTLRHRWTAPIKSQLEAIASVLEAWQRDAVVPLLSSFKCLLAAIRQNFTCSSPAYQAGVPIAPASLGGHLDSPLGRAADPRAQAERPSQDW
jgi:hypothetical protein